MSDPILQLKEASFSNVTVRSTQQHAHVNIPTTLQSLTRRLIRIFNDAPLDNSAMNRNHSEACDYYKEVLLTYRIIFSQTKHSPGDCLSAHQETWSHSLEYLTSADPLLQQLCTQSWDAEDLHCFYREINSGDPSAQYSPSSDFPFFGKRLLDLQAYVKTYRPSGFWALWYDERNEGWWWAFWVGQPLCIHPRIYISF